MGLESCRCLACGWSGVRADLIGVASGGLSLEDAVGKLMMDLLGMFKTQLERPLSFFLARWGVVDPEDPDQAGAVCSAVAGRMASGVLEYCMLGTDQNTDGEPMSGPDADACAEQYYQSMASNLLEILLRGGLLRSELPSEEALQELRVVMGKLQSEVEHLLLDSYDDDEEEGESDGGIAGSGGEVQ